MNQRERNEKLGLKAEIDALQAWVTPFRPLIQAEETRLERERVKQLERERLEAERLERVRLEAEKARAKQQLEADNVAKGVSMLDSSW